MPWSANYLLMAVITTCGGFLGAFLSGYLRRKGENLATHEDVSKLLDQVRAVTQTTKEIEAKFSGELWSRQKRWEMRREVLFSAAKALSQVDEALVNFSSALNADLDRTTPIWHQGFLDLAKKWMIASAQLDEATTLITIVCGQETQVSFAAVGYLATTMATGISQQDGAAYAASRQELTKRIFEARAAMRRELEIDAPRNAMVVGGAG